jgi:hypothetical protein
MSGGEAPVASPPRRGYIQQRTDLRSGHGKTMRAETQSLIGEIKQSLELLRRHL